MASSCCSPAISRSRPTPHEIGDGHLNFGQLPGAGGSQRLPRAVGLLRAKHLMLTGELLSAEDARQIGLVNEVVPAAELDAAVNRCSIKLRDKSRVGLSGAKHLANATLTMDLDAGLRHEIEFVHRYATTEPDAIEGLVAFKEKRKPRLRADESLRPEMYSLRDKYAIAGIGWTDYSKNSGRTVRSLASEACLKAIGDAGLSREGHRRLRQLQFQRLGARDSGRDRDRRAGCALRDGFPERRQCAPT